MYAKYVEAINEKEMEHDEKNLLAKKMTECSEKFLKQIERAEEEQDEFEERKNEKRLDTKSSDFAASAEAFNAMVDVQDEFSVVEELPQIPQQNNLEEKNENNKKQERMLL